MNAMTYLFVCILIMVFTIGNFQVLKAEKCGANERQLSCARPLSCQSSCSHPNGTVCPRKRNCVINGCECEKGYVRNNNNNNECILPSQCIIPLKTLDISNQCDPNEVHKSCSPPLRCQPTCDQPAGSVCPAICSDYPCQCKPGYVRISKDNRTCIEKNQCVQQCGENEEVNRFATQCQASCDDLNRKPCPRLRYSKGCVCKEGFSRASNNVTSPCIQCPITLDSY